MMALEELQRMPCSTCEGSKEIVLAELDHDLYDQPVIKNVCPSCLENGTPTRLAPLALALTKGCPNCSDHPVYKKRCSCGGTGRVPTSPPEQLWALLEHLRNRGGVCIYSPVKGKRWAARLDSTAIYPGEGDTPLEALAAAVSAVLRAFTKALKSDTEGGDAQ